jgi:peptidoglycan hydrolase-like protein with peptidoglycan-binding domain
VRRLLVLITTLTCAAIAVAPAAALDKVQVPGLQVALYRKGYYKGPIDGIAGPLTKKAIVQFQRSARLPPDGVAGKQTRAALGRFGRPLFGKRTMSRGMVGFDVSVLQFLLAKHGLPPRALNSNFGPVTQKLVKRFQRKAGIPADGIVGPLTRSALLSPNGKPPKSAVRRTRARARATYVVRPGDTLTGIAGRFGTTVERLARLNRLDPRKPILIGMRLVVPRTRTRTMASSRSDIRASLNRWAAHYGVDPSLARALAWQESGFQSNVRSSAGAFGVMQVTPATWEFVELFVIGMSVPRTADGNVRVGVAFLDHLLGQFRGDVRLAVGAYYQGPASVRKRGLFRETERFVANVLALRGRV